MSKKSLLHSGYLNGTLRSWQSNNSEIAPNNVIYPIFLVEDEDSIETIKTKSGVLSFGINQLKKHLDVLTRKGLTSVLLFGVVENLPKDDIGSNADSTDNPVVKALSKLRSWFPNLTIACDVCLCAYTTHGHCGILYSDGTINNSASIQRIAEVALAYAKAGAHIVAPSDMMDGRIGAIKDQLVKNNLGNKVAVVSYALKFSSSFYGPSRDAANSKPAFGDRRRYQLPPNSSGLPHRAAERDVMEGADMLMVKPGLSYLDLVQSVKKAHPQHPMFIYQVSREYAMIYHAANKWLFDLKVALTEILTSMRRAGADVIITYYTPVILDWLLLKNKY